MVGLRRSLHQSLYRWFSRLVHSVEEFSVVAPVSIQNGPTDEGAGYRSPPEQQTESRRDRRLSRSCAGAACRSRRRATRRRSERRSVSHCRQGHQGAASIHALGLMSNDPCYLVATGAPFWWKCDGLSLRSFRQHEPAGIRMVRWVVVGDNGRQAASGGVQHALTNRVCGWRVDSGLPGRRLTRRSFVTVQAVHAVRSAAGGDRLAGEHSQSCSRPSGGSRPSGRGQE